MYVSPFISPFKPYQVRPDFVVGDAEDLTATLVLDFQNNRYLEGVWDFGGSLLLDFSRQSYVIETTQWYDFDWSLNLEFDRNVYRLNV